MRMRKYKTRPTRSHCTLSTSHMNMTKRHDRTPMRYPDSVDHTPATMPTKPITTMAKLSTMAHVDSSRPWIAKLQSVGRISEISMHVKAPGGGGCRFDPADSLG